MSPRIPTANTIGAGIGRMQAAASPALSRQILCFNEEDDMEVTFAAQQGTLGMPECERLCGRPSRDVFEFASQCGYQGLSSQPLSVPLRMALDMMIVSDSSGYGVEGRAIGPWLGGLRTETLLKMGEHFEAWSLVNASDHSNQFLPLLYGSRDVVRPRIARMLGVSAAAAVRQLRFHTPSDVECLSNTMVEAGLYSDRAPRFVIDAHILADRFLARCSSAPFVVKVSGGM